MSWWENIPDYIANLLAKIFGSRNERLIEELKPVVEQIKECGEALRNISDEKLAAKTNEFKKRLKGGETLDEILPEAFAVVRETSHRILGNREYVKDKLTGKDIPFMAHFDVQLMGGIVLHQGKIAEMVTGEGKTLVATLPAYLNALTGKGVHIITVNDYLARRDSEWMAPIFEFLGMTVGCIQSGNMNTEDKRAAYQSDITYGQNNEFGFDYLRDNMKFHAEELVQGPLNYAIIDEVDSILIDEARTPLIISGPAEESTEKYYNIDRIIPRLKEGEDFTVNEKDRNVVLSEEGYNKMEKMLGMGDLYSGKNIEMPHFIDNALQAHYLYKRDRDYVVKDNEIVIVDEFTGRLMPGRRWSNGLHQAIEAKERIRIKEENQTLGTITFQNFFKLYNKLSGMTGTAMTEAAEFLQIYDLDVVSVPTNIPLRRQNLPDLIYGSGDEKYTAILDEIEFIHKRGQPILVGTISIETSEMLSKRLERRGVKHEVLNAKHHQKEAQIVSKAGEFGHVTIATNMAGRGTDIVLGKFDWKDLLAHWQKFGLAPKKIKNQSNRERVQEQLVAFWADKFLKDMKSIPESTEGKQEALNKYWNENGYHPLRLCESVADLGGLFILGTERHEARRIDNQLRGRSGRQGDPGYSRFFLSLEDDLMRIFAPERVASILRSLGLKEGQPIEHSMVTRSIERAQKKVEERNFGIRKNVLEYDTVMDEQRKIIYSQRQEILTGKNLKDEIVKMAEDVIRGETDYYFMNEIPEEERNYDEYVTRFNRMFDLNIQPDDLKGMEGAKIADMIHNRFLEKYNAKRERVGDEVMDTIENFILLQAIDSKWKDHLYNMDHLKEGIHLRGYAQKDPKIEYKREGYELFADMIGSIKHEISDLILKIEISAEEERDMFEDIWVISDTQHKEVSQFESQQEREAALIAAGGEDEPPPTFTRTNERVGRNDPCPCGSGKKYKKCCGT